MLRSASDCRLQERKIAEAWCEAHHIPTRTRDRRTAAHGDRAAARAARAAPSAAPHASGAPPPRASRRRASASAAQARPLLRIVTMATTRKSPPRRRSPSSATSTSSWRAGSSMLQRAQGRGRADRHRRQGGGVPRGQDHALPLQAAPPSARSATPVLVAYGQVGRYTMADLQEDRSMLRNLLALGSTSTRSTGAARRAATAGSRFEDYVDGYLADCVEHICKAHGIAGDQPARHLRRRRVHAVLRGAVSRSA